MLNSRERGDLGEKIAINFLRQKNYQIIDTNYFIWNYEKSKKVAEIDIICQLKETFVNQIFSYFKKKNQRIIFLEVKSLFVNNLDDLVFPEKKVNFVKKQKIKKAAFSWLKKNKKTVDYPWRMDLIILKILKTDQTKYKLTHFKNILY